MTFGAPSPRPCRCPCTCQDPGPLADRLRLAAAAYATGLTDGEEIDSDFGGTDHEYVKPFAAYLPEALINAGFTIHARLEQGRVVTTVHKQETT